MPSPPPSPPSPSSPRSESGWELLHPSSPHHYHVDFPQQHLPSSSPSSEDGHIKSDYFKPSGVTFFPDGEISPDSAVDDDGEEKRTPRASWIDPEPVISSRSSILKGRHEDSNEFWSDTSSDDHVTNREVYDGFGGGVGEVVFGLNCEKNEFLEKMSGFNGDDVTEGIDGVAKRSYEGVREVGFRVNCETEGFEVKMTGFEGEDVVFQSKDVSLGPSEFSFKSGGGVGEVVFGLGGVKEEFEVERSIFAGKDVALQGNDVSYRFGVGVKEAGLGINGENEEFEVSEIGGEITSPERVVDVEEGLESSGDGRISGSAGGGKEGVVWWKASLEFLKGYVIRMTVPVWSLGVAAAVIGFVMLGRRLSRMKRKAKNVPLKVTLEGKKLSQFMTRAARLNEAFSVVKRVPVIHPSLPAPAGTPWPVTGLR